VDAAQMLGSEWVTKDSDFCGRRLMKVSNEN
jgi:hypothetical protein